MSTLRCTHGTCGGKLHRDWPTDPLDEARCIACGRAAAPPVKITPELNRLIMQGCTVQEGLDLLQREIEERLACDA